MAQPESRVSLPELEQILEGLEGAERFDAIYLWMEENPEAKPELSFHYGQQAIRLLNEEVPPTRVQELFLSTAQAAWLLGEMQQASELAGRSAKSAREHEDEEAEFEALMLMTSADRRRGEAIAAMDDCLRLVDLASNAQNQLRALNSLALAYRALEDLPLALETYLEALEVSLSIPGDEGLDMRGTLYANIGRVHESLGQLEQAAENTEKGLEYLEQYDGPGRIAAHVKYNLGSYLRRLGDPQAALRYHSEALEVLERLGDGGQVKIFLLSELALHLAALSRHEEALKRSAEAMELARTTDNPAWTFKAMSLRGELMQELGRSREAREQLEAALELSDSVKGFDKVEVMKKLATVHEDREDWALALDLLREATELEDALVDDKHRRLFAEWRARLDAATTESRLLEADNAKRLQAAELRRQRTQSNALAAVAVLLGLSGAAMIASYRRQKRVLVDLEIAHGQLTVKKQKLEEALSHVNLLSGMLPICSGCKSIRDDQGYWQMVEQYISSHSEAEFSHSICPDCVKRLYPDFEVAKKI